MKKIVRNEVENIIYKSDNISMHRVNGAIHLLGAHDYTINEVFEIIIWGMKNRADDTGFWDIMLTQIDRQDSRPINMIYWFTGGDKIWKSGNWIWKKEWKEMSQIFAEHFDKRMNKLTKTAKTLGDLRDKITKKISCEDFYELGIMLDLINKEDTL